MARAPTTLVPVFGTNRLNADKPAAHLNGCSFLAVPFAGGMSELRHFTGPRTVVVNDKHSHIINLAMIAADPTTGLALRRKLKRLAFHPMILRHAQSMCRAWEQQEKWDGSTPSLQWAVDYFVCAWMARNGTAATDDEFETGLSIRWDAAGGDSVVRFRSAIAALRDWQTALARCTFQCLDAFAFLNKCKDAEDHGIYADPPWPSDGDQYKHKFPETKQRDLADHLSCYTKTRVVVRFGNHPLIRELYPEQHWTWNMVTGRTQTNRDKAEVLLTNKV